MDTMAAIRETFFQECDEQLAALESGLLAMDAGDRDPETVNAVFRAVHSIKGGAGAFGLDNLVRFAHVFETTLDEVRASRLTINPAVLNVLLRSADALSDLVKAARGGGVVDAERDSALAIELAAFAAHSKTAAPVAEPIPAASDADDDEFGFKPVRIELDAPTVRTWTIRFQPEPAMYAKANESTVLLRELSHLGSVDVALDTSKLPILPDLDPEGAYLTWTITLTTSRPEDDIRGVFEFVEGDCKLSILAADVTNDGQSDASASIANVPTLLNQVNSPAVETDITKQEPSAVVVSTPTTVEVSAGATAIGMATRSSESSSASPARATIRVDLDRVDRLIDLVGELGRVCKGDDVSGV